MITAALILAFLAITTLLAMGSGWNNVLSTDRNDLVFADRNRAYGAYKIRQEHHVTMLWALGAGLALVGAVAILPQLFSVPMTIADAPGKETIVILDPPMDPPTETVKPRVEPPMKPSTEPPVPGGVPIAVDSAVTTPVDTVAKGTDPVDPGTGKGKPGGVDSTATPGGDPDDSGRVRQGYEADSSPEYIGGETAMFAFLRKNIDYPERDRIEGTQGRVIVSFVVMPDGAITDASVVKGVSPGIDAEALRVVRRMGKWIPGKFRGKDVPVRCNLPILFKLEH